MTVMFPDNCLLGAQLCQKVSVKIHWAYSVAAVLSVELKAASTFALNPKPSGVHVFGYVATNDSCPFARKNGASPAKMCGKLGFLRNRSFKRTI